LSLRSDNLDSIVSSKALAGAKSGISHAPPIAWALERLKSFIRSIRSSLNRRFGGILSIGFTRAISICVVALVPRNVAASCVCAASDHAAAAYGFVIYVVTTVIMVFVYPTPAAPTPANLPTLWYIGALMVCLGGYWFWFFIRVDVAAEGNSPFRFVRADLFIVSLVLSVTFGLVWACIQATGNVAWAYVFLALYLLTTTMLFGSIPWSKFSHIFFKPAAALEKRVAEANGTRSNLPAPADAPRIYGSVPRQTLHY